jgi:hypothetical protein
MGNLKKLSELFILKILIFFNKLNQCFLIQEDLVLIDNDTYLNEARICFWYT